LGRSAIKKGFKTILILLEALPVIGIGLSVLYFHFLKKKKRAVKVFFLSCRTALISLIGIIAYLSRIFFFHKTLNDSANLSSEAAISSIFFAIVFGLLFDAVQSIVFDVKEGVWALCDHRRAGDWFDAFYDLSEDAMTGYGSGAIAYLFL